MHRRRRGLNSFVSLPSIFGCATIRLRSQGCGATGEGLMNRTGKVISAGLMAAVLALAAGAANAKDKVKLGFIGPLTGGVSVHGIGGPNSARLAVKLRKPDAKAEYGHETAVRHDRSK